MALKAKKVKAVEANSPATWSVAKFSSFYTQNRSELIAHANRIVKDVAKADYKKVLPSKSLKIQDIFVSK